MSHPERVVSVLAWGLSFLVLAAPVLFPHGPEVEARRLVHAIERDFRNAPFCGTVRYPLTLELVSLGPEVVPLLERLAPGSPAKKDLRWAIDRIETGAASQEASIASTPARTESP